jgi:F-box/leucine-rich repeat protein 2/20
MLDFVGFDHLHDHNLEIIANSCSLIRNLNFTYCSEITDDGLKFLTDSCHNLESLTLWGCYLITNNGINFVANNCKKLKQLNVRCCKQITDSGLQVIAENLPNMEHLNFTYCKNLTDYGVGNLCMKLPHLTHLTLAYCSSVSDLTVRALTIYCLRIKHLDVTATRITDVALLFILQSQLKNKLAAAKSLNECVNSAKNEFEKCHCKANFVFEPLESLVLTACGNISEVGARHIRTRCLDLKHFVVDDCSQISKPSQLQLRLPQISS